MQAETTRPGTYVEQRFARVATIRDGDNAVEMKDNRDGTADLTVFWYDEKRDRSDDLTAYRLKRDDLMALRRAIDGMLIQIAGSATNA